MSAKYLEWARQQEKKVDPEDGSRRKEVKHPTINIKKQNNPDNAEKTIDLSSAQPSKSHMGRCEGCGKDQSQKRFITNEFLCPDCRDDLRYKLITKSTVARLYPLLTVNDLTDAIAKQRIRCYKTKNWHNPRAAPIKLFYEQEIMDLSRRKERKTTSRSRDHSDKHSQSRTTEENKRDYVRNPSSYDRHRSEKRSPRPTHHRSSHHHHHTSKSSSINLQIEKV